jgi:hypothetical protein
VKRKETPEQLAARYLKWIKTPAGKKALLKAKKLSEHTREMFKQRPRTAEELNRRYKVAQA